MSELLTKISYSFSALLSCISLMSLNHFALILGMFLGLMTFVVTWVYKHKTYKLQQQYSQHYQDVDKTITYNKRYSQEAESHGGAETPKNG